MPEQEKTPVNLHQDPLVEKLMPDPSQHANVQALTGFLGNSSQAGFWRLYLTPTLDRYLEIPEADIVHSQSLTSEQNPQGGTVLWVKQDAAITLHTRTDLRQTQAQFLQGDIMAGTQAMPATALRQRMAGTWTGLWYCPFWGGRPPSGNCRPIIPDLGEELLRAEAAAKVGGAQIPPDPFQAPQE